MAIFTQTFLQELLSVPLMAISIQTFLQELFSVPLMAIFTRPSIRNLSPSLLWQSSPRPSFKNLYPSLPAEYTPSADSNCRALRELQMGRLSSACSLPWGKLPLNMLRVYEIPTIKARFCQCQSDSSYTICSGKRKTYDKKNKNLR